MFELQEGARVLVRTLTGDPMELVVTAYSDEGDPLFCTPEEHEAAIREQRVALTVGWPPEDILSVVSEEEGMRRSA